MEAEIIKTLGPWGLVVVAVVYIFVMRLHKPNTKKEDGHLGLSDVAKDSLKILVKDAVEDVLAPALDRMEHAITLQTRSIDVLAATNQGIQVSMEGIRVLLEVQMQISRKGGL